MINRIASIIKTKPKAVPSLVRINALALKKIFDTLTLLEERELEYGVNMWTNSILPRLKDVGQSALSEHYSKELKVILNALISAENGDFKKEKAIFKDFGIDYRKVYSEGL